MYIHLCFALVRDEFHNVHDKTIGSSTQCGFLP